MSVDGAGLAPFAGWMVKPEWADRVIARAYDTFSPEERRARSATNPFSYLNVTRSPEDALPGETTTVEGLVAEAASAFRRLLEAEVFEPSGRPTFYLYRMTTHGRSQTGLVGTVPVAAIVDGRVRVHENVRPDRAALLTRHLKELGATSSPIAVTFRTSRRYAALVAALTVDVPALDVLSSDSDVRHEIWVVPEDHNDGLHAIFEERVLYLTDGHHRAAAAIAAREEAPDAPAFARTLAIAFPEDHLRIEAFHRIVTDAFGRPPEVVLEALRTVADIHEVAGLDEARPVRAGEVGMYLAGRWYHFDLPDPAADTPLDRLDAERLRACLIDPILGGDELGLTGAVQYVAEPTGVDEVVRRCEEQGAIGFVVHPTGIEELMAVADAGQLMPPKSSYVVPKPCAGVFLRVLGTGETAGLPPS